MGDTKKEGVIPGFRIGSIDEYDAGIGTYQRGNYIYSSLVGFKRVVTFDNVENEEEKVFNLFSFFPNTS